MQSITKWKLLGILSLTAFFGFAQQLPSQGNWCGTDSYNAQLMQQDPAAKENYERTIHLADKYVRENFIPSKGKSATYTIPVVFHVIHTNGPENISNSSLINAINRINTNFRKMRSDTAMIEPPFDQIYPDCQIEFRLAKIDPDGNCTQGITRTYSSLHIEASDAVKNLIAWPNEKYLNIWIVSSIGISASAYAQFPGGPNSTDGIVCMAGSLGSLTHEIGHSMGLPHTWGSTNDPGCDGTSNSGPCAGVDNCNMDDGIADTPNARGTFGCWNLQNNSCGDSPIPFVSIFGDTIWPASSGEIHENLQNYMSYAGCSARNFTDGQKARMHGILNSTTNNRNNLWSAANLIATGTNDGYTCDPVATPEFALPYEYICTGEYVAPINASYGADFITYQWDFGPFGYSSEGTLKEPAFVFNEPGFHDITLTTTSSGGSKSLTKTEIAKVISGIPIEPFHETFASSTFPVNDVDDFSQNWMIHTFADSVLTWERNLETSTHGGASIKLDLKKTTGVHRLFAPMLDMTQADCSQLTFDLAYAGRTALTLDKFKVRVSTTCGKTWPESKVLYEVMQQDIAPHQLTISGDYVPTDAGWKSHTVDLSDYMDETGLHIMFEVETSGGNALYMDNVVFGCNSRSIASVSEGAKARFELIPNPSNGDARIVLDGFKGAASVSIYNVNGKHIATRQANATQHNSMQVSDIANAPLSPGVYLVTVTGQHTSATQKLIVR